MILLMALLPVAYLAGSVNFSILLLRVLGQGDPRDRFSGNAGVSNVRRQVGMGWAALVLVLDLGRAAGVASLGLALLPPHLVVWLSLGLLLGNRFPCLHGFRGGKGVAALLGFTLPLAPHWAAVACGVWLLIWALVRQAFLGSFGMVAMLAAGLGAATGWHPSGLIAAVAAAAFVVAAHHSNLRRFLMGDSSATEGR